MGLNKFELVGDVISDPSAITAVAPTAATAITLVDSALGTDSTLVVAIDSTNGLVAADVTIFNNWAATFLGAVNALIVDQVNRDSSQSLLRADTATVRTAVLAIDSQLGLANS